jgi:hypothetical protein
MARKGIIIGIIVAVAVVAALVAMGINANSGSTTPASIEGNQTQQNEDRIAAMLGNDPNRVNDPGWRQTATDILSTEHMDKALLVIHSDTSWSAVVQGSDFVQETVDGSGNRAIEVECEPNGIFSHVVQKGTVTGVIDVYMAQDGRIIKQGGTAAEYGVVSVAGNCAG